MTYLIDMRSVTVALAGAVAAGLALASPAKADCQTSETTAPGWKDRSVMSQEQSRQYKLLVPESYSSDEPMPLIIDLQASGITPDVEVQITGMASAADRHGFLLAAPEATYPFPRGGHTWNIPPNSDAPSDVEFVERVVQQVGEEFCLDEDKVFAIGYSGGARLASEIACRRPDLVDGIAAVGGLRHPEAGCVTDGPAVSLIAFHSTTDPINPYEVNESAPPYWRYGVEAAVARWVNTNECDADALTEMHGSASRNIWTGCRSGARLEFYRLENAGHVWPGSAFSFPGFVGKPEPALPASRLILEFFGLSPDGAS